MKRVICALLLLAFLSPALASAADNKMPDATPSSYIALLYEKLTNQSGKSPDFVGWVKDWSKYKKADFMERQKIMDEKVKSLENTYRLLTWAEPIVIKAKVQISAYSPLGKGFFVQNFTDMTFFRFYHMGQGYAVIPNGMANYQWLKAPPGMADIVMRETKNGTEAIVTITMTSMKADPEPMVMGNRKYKLLMAEVSKIELWSRDRKNIIWDDQIGSRDPTQRKLLNLRQ